MVRLSATERELIEHAADLTGDSPSGFLRNAGVAAARAVLANTEKASE
jgi:uncharacterized protein (DUF1778 family)